jgi:hypothetical protein
MKIRILSLLILFLPLAAIAQLPDVKGLRKQFYESVDNSTTANSFYALLTEADLASKPLYQGYQGMANLLMAKHSWMPWNKISYFNSGKACLEKAIRLDPQNTELRFLRFCVQKNAPSFLGYYGAIDADFEFLTQYLKETDPNKDDKDLYHRIILYLLRECNCMSNEMTLNLYDLTQKWFM